MLLVWAAASLVLLHPSCLSQNWNSLLSSEAGFWVQLVVASPQVLHLSKQQQENFIKPQSHEKKPRLIRWTHTQSVQTAVFHRGYHLDLKTPLCLVVRVWKSRPCNRYNNVAQENLPEMHWKPPLHISLQFCLLKMGQLWGWHCSLPSTDHTSLKTENTGNSSWSPLVYNVITLPPLTSFFLASTSRPWLQQEKGKSRFSFYINTHLYIKIKLIVATLSKSFFAKEKKFLDKSTDQTLIWTGAGAGQKINFSWDQSTWHYRNVILHCICSSMGTSWICEPNFPVVLLVKLAIVIVKRALQVLERKANLCWLLLLLRVWIITGVLTAALCCLGYRNCFCFGHSWCFSCK